MFNIERSVRGRPVLAMLEWATRKLVIYSFVILMLPPPTGRGQGCQVGPCPGGPGNVMTITCQNGDTMTYDCCSYDPCMQDPHGNCQGDCVACTFYDSCAGEFVQDIFCCIPTG